MPQFLPARTNKRRGSAITCIADRTSSCTILGDPRLLWLSLGPGYLSRPPDPLGTGARVVGVKTAADGLRTMAEGYRPSTKEQQWQLEQQATIQGGIIALQGAGAYPWSHVVVDAFPPLYFTKGGKRQAALNRLATLVRQAAERKGDTFPKGTLMATEYVRSQVARMGVSVPAWAARGMYLTGEALANQTVRGSAEGTTGQILDTAGKEVAKIPPVGTIVGAIMIAVGWAFKGAAARTAIEAKRSQEAYSSFSQMYEQGMQDAVVKMEGQIASRELELAQEELERLEAEAEKKGKELGRKIAKGVEIGSWALGFGATGLAGWWVYSRWEKRRTRG